MMSSTREVDQVLGDKKKSVSFDREDLCILMTSWLTETQVHPESQTDTLS